MGGSLLIFGREEKYKVLQGVGGRVRIFYGRMFIKFLKRLKMVGFRRNPKEEDVQVFNPKNCDDFNCHKKKTLNMQIPKILV